MRAVDGVSFQVFPGETLGIVGESGSGKSVTALSIIRLLQEQSRIASGKIVFRDRDIVAMNEDEVRSLRGGKIAMVFQDPMTSLNPVRRISDQLVEAMVIHGRHDRPSALRRAIDLLGRMGITAPERAIVGFPHQFSGGMRQRVMLAMGFSNEPVLLLADEPTTALDVTIQAQILDLLRELNADFSAAIVLISHDLGVIANVCSRVVVMYAGEVVEEGSDRGAPRRSEASVHVGAAQCRAAPRPGHAGREAPRRRSRARRPIRCNWPKGCRFAQRCPFRIEKCDEHPELLPVGEQRRSRCWVTQMGQNLPRRATARAAHAPGRDDRDSAAANARGTDPRNPRPRQAFPGAQGNAVLRAEQVVHAVDGVDLDRAIAARPWGSSANRGAASRRWRD